MKRAVVEARLHYDAHDEGLRARAREIFDEFEVGDTRPTYRLIDPKSGELVDSFNLGAPRAEPEKGLFVEFLKSWSAH